MGQILNSDTIAAVSTPHGTGGIAVIRLSGPEALKIFSKSWRGINPDKALSHSAHLGMILDVDGSEIDSVVATFFKAPNSFTGEDTVEISCHGSQWIQREIINTLIRRGARAAEPGEFTQRAFLNGKMDLAQAEGVADLIASSSKAAQQIAIRQVNGRFTTHLENLRQKLIELASLLELELDFSEEDVEFASRDALRDIATQTLRMIKHLAGSYAAGQAFRDGIPVVIAGAPNAGKSTLLNLLLQEEKAIVSNIPGTTRDIIEDTREIDGILYRFIDTAGLRDSADQIEKIGIQRAENQIAKARIAIWLISPEEDIDKRLTEIHDKMRQNPEALTIVAINKNDQLGDESQKIISRIETDSKKNENKSLIIFSISAKTGKGVEEMMERIADEAKSAYNPDSDIIITNARHYGALLKGAESLERVIPALDSGLSADLLSQDIREALHHLGTITGAITTPDLLSSIFSRFCIGK